MNTQNPSAPKPPPAKAAAVPAPTTGPAPATVHTSPADTPANLHPPLTTPPGAAPASTPVAPPSRLTDAAPAPGVTPMPVGREPVDEPSPSGRNTQPHPGVRLVKGPDGAVRKLKVETGFLTDPASFSWNGSVFRRTVDGRTQTYLFEADGKSVVFTDVDGSKTQLEIQP